MCSECSHMHYSILYGEVKPCVNVNSTYECQLTSALCHYCRYYSTLLSCHYLRQPQICFDSTRSPHEYVSIISQQPQLHLWWLLTYPDVHRLHLLLLLLLAIGDRLSGSLSSSLSASKAAGDLKALEILLLSLNLCGLVTVMAPSRSSLSCSSCDDGTLSSRENLWRALQKN